MGFLLLSCKSNPEQSESTTPIINLSERVTEVPNLFLSDAVEKVEIVPLETTNESLLKTINLIEITDESIFVYQTGAEILRFSHDGKFMNKVGKKGQGPGEYIYIDGFQIDENKSEIYVITTANGVLVYDYEGTFKRKAIDHTDLKTLFSSIINKQYLLSNERFFFTQTLPFTKPVTKDSIWSVSVTDKQFQIKNTFCNPAYQEQIETINKNLAGKGNNYLTDYPISMDSYHNEITLKYSDTDTIFVYDMSTQQLKPQYSIYSKEDKGAYVETHLWLKERSAFDYFSIYSYYPTKDFIYLISSKNDEIYTFAYNKKDATVKLSRKQGTIIERKLPWNTTHRRLDRPFILTNDICGGEFNIRYRSQGKYWIDIQALNYEEYLVDTEKLASSPVKNEQNKQALLDTFKQLNEDSNPVLLIAKLK